MNNTDKEEDFETLLNKNFTKIENFEPGQLIETTIVSISEDCIFLELNGKREGQLDKAELINKDGKLTVKIGDKISAFFLTTEKGEMIFTTKISGDKADKAILENAFENGIPMDGVVEKEIKGGFEIKIGDNRGFCPYSQMGEQRVDDPQIYIGKHLTFKIIEHSENGKNILLSNRAIYEEIKAKKIESLKNFWHEKMIIKGKVTQIEKFGAFVDVEGIRTLLPISEISRTRVENINNFLKVGQEIEAAILNLDWKNEKISISTKELIKDPWDSVTEKYKIDSKHSGKVVRITNYGVFVSLEPGLDGLIHISELKGDSRDNNPNDIVKMGEELTVLINGIDLKQKRISLKHVSSVQEENDFAQYMDSDNNDDTDTYNPFVALLKK